MYTGQEKKRVIFSIRPPLECPDGVRVSGIRYYRVDSRVIIRRLMTAAVTPVARDAQFNGQSQPFSACMGRRQMIDFLSRKGDRLVLT